MKVNLVPTIIAIAISLLIVYGLYCFHVNENKMLLSAGGFVFLAITSILAIGTSFEFPRTTTNIRVVSGVFFVIALISSIVFAFLNLSAQSYLIINGLLLLVFIFIAYSIFKAKQ